MRQKYVPKWQYDELFDRVALLERKLGRLSTDLNKRTSYNIPVVDENGKAYPISYCGKAFGATLADGAITRYNSYGPYYEEGVNCSMQKLVEMFCEHLGVELKQVRPRPKTELCHKKEEKDEQGE